MDKEVRFLVNLYKNNITNEEIDVIVNKWEGFGLLYECMNKKMVALAFEFVAITTLKNAKHSYPQSYPMTIFPVVRRIMDMYYSEFELPQKDIFEKTKIITREWEAELSKNNFYIEDYIEINKVNIDVEAELLAKFCNNFTFDVDIKDNLTNGVENKDILKIDLLGCSTYYNTNIINTHDKEKIVPILVEPIIKNRFKVIFEDNIDIKSWFVSDITMPCFENNYFNDIEITFLSVISPNTSQLLFDNFKSRKNFTFTIDMLDCTLKTVQQWIIYVKKVKSIDFGGKLNYSDNDLLKPKVIFEVENVILKF